MKKYQLILFTISDAFLKLSFGLVFFNYGYGKLITLATGNPEALISMIEAIPLFGRLPIFFSWVLALGEVGILLGLIYGLFYTLPISNLVTKISGIVSLIISLVIVYQHLFSWGDNIFSYGPFDFLNTQDGKKSIFGQFLFLPISMYIIFSTRPNLNIINDSK